LGDTFASLSLIVRIPEGAGCGTAHFAFHQYPHSRLYHVQTKLSTVPERIMSEKEGFNEVLIEPLKQFAKDSMHLVKKCTKPDRKEFMLIARATGLGFLIMGFIGFFVKLIHIPINNILIGQ